METVLELLFAASGGVLSAVGLVGSLASRRKSRSRSSVTLTDSQGQQVFISYKDAEFDDLELRLLRGLAGAKSGTAGPDK